MFVWKKEKKILAFIKYHYEGLPAHCLHGEKKETCLILLFSNFIIS